MKIKEEVESGDENENRADQSFVLRLYITGASPNSVRAINNLRQLCEIYIKDKYFLEIVDVYQQLELAREEQIIALPLLIKKLPLPERRLIGDMSDSKKCSRASDLQYETSMSSGNKSYEQLVIELESLKCQLDEANETIEAIRTGQIDALVVQGNKGHEIYTLKSSDQTYRVFIEKMTEGAVTLNKDGIIQYSNSKFASMVQMPLSYVIGLPFQQFITDEYQEPFRRVLEKGWREDSKGEVLLAGKECLIPVQLSLATLDLDEGFALSIILTDLTAQKKTQSQLAYNNSQLEQMNYALEVSNHDLQQFASVASHDLQEPLRKILIFSDLLRDKQSDSASEVSMNFVNKIIESANRMRTLIMDILNYSRLSESKDTFEQINLNQVFHDVLNDYEISIRDKKAHITAQDLPMLEANKGQMRQVFQNIISNALKFSKENQSPEITVSVKRISAKSFDAALQDDGPYFMISISDNGIGFDERYLANIFALFERLNAKDKYEGTGIGMAITKKIIEKHHGLITALSAEGEGSEFIIILPELQIRRPEFSVQDLEFKVQGSEFRV